MKRFCGHCEWGSTAGTVRVVYRAAGPRRRGPLGWRVSWVCRRHLEAELEELRYLAYEVKVD